MDNKWTYINTQEDIDQFMNMFGYFHDGCIKELRYESGAYVGNDLAMYPINSKRNVSVIFQRQFKNPSAVELVFEGVEHLNLQPVNDEYTTEILGAHMCIEDVLYVWFDSDYFSQDYTDLYKLSDVTWIKAHKVKWRAADEYLGGESIYINRI